MFILGINGRVGNNSPGPGIIILLNCTSVHDAEEGWDPGGTLEKGRPYISLP